MDEYWISKSWLTKQVEYQDADWAWAAEQFKLDYREGDELWYFEEPAPPGVNAGAMGIALVRDGEPIRTAITAVH